MEVLHTSGSIETRQLRSMNEVLSYAFRRDSDAMVCHTVNNLRYAMYLYGAKRPKPYVIVTTMILRSRVNNAQMPEEVVYAGTVNDWTEMVRQSEVMCRSGLLNSCDLLKKMAADCRGEK